MSEEKVTLQVFQKDTISEWKNYIPYYFLCGQGDSTLRIHLFPEKCPILHGFIKPLTSFNPKWEAPISRLQVDTTKPKLLILNLKGFEIVKDEGVIKIFIYS